MLEIGKQVQDKYRVQVNTVQVQVNIESGYHFQLSYLQVKEKGSEQGGITDTDKWNNNLMMRMMASIKGQ